MGAGLKAWAGSKISGPLSKISLACLFPLVS